METPGEPFSKKPHSYTSAAPRSDPLSRGLLHDLANEEAKHAQKELPFVAASAHAWTRPSLVSYLGRSASSRPAAGTSAAYVGTQIATPGSKVKGWRAAFGVRIPPFQLGCISAVPDRSAGYGVPSPSPGLNSAPRSRATPSSGLGFGAGERVEVEAALPKRSGAEKERLPILERDPHKPGNRPQDKWGRSEDDRRQREILKSGEALRQLSLQEGKKNDKLRSEISARKAQAKGWQEKLQPLAAHAAQHVAEAERQEQALVAATGGWRSLRSLLTVSGAQCAQLRDDAAAVRVAVSAAGLPDSAEALEAEAREGLVAQCDALERGLEEVSAEAKVLDDKISGAESEFRSMADEQHAALHAAESWCDEIDSKMWRREQLDEILALVELEELHKQLRPLCDSRGALRRTARGGESLAAAAAAELGEAQRKQLELLELLEEVGTSLEEWRIAFSPPSSSSAVLVALSAAQQQVVDDLLGSFGPGHEELFEINNVPVTRNDISRLCPCEWLNDEVVNYFMQLLAQHNNEHAAQQPQTPLCHFTNSNFYPKLAEGGASGRDYNYAGVRRWTKRVDVFKKDVVVFPIHCHGNHWTLALIYPQLRRFVYYDSLFGPPSRVLSNLRRWLQDEHKDKKQLPLDVSDWEQLVNVEGSPHQHNGFDCGMFMCRTAEFLSRGLDLSFTQDDMPYFRRRMVLEIASSSLLPYA